MLSTKGRKATFPLLSSLLSLLWKSRAGELEKSEERKENSEEYKKKKPLARLFFLVRVFITDVSSCEKQRNQQRSPHGWKPALPVVAGVGFVGPSENIVATGARHSRASVAPCFRDALRQNTAPRCFGLLTHDLREPGGRSVPPPPQNKRAGKQKTARMGCFFWLRGWDLNLTTSGL